MWEMVAYAWLATTPMTGEGSVKVEMKLEENTQPYYYKTEDACMEEAGNFNLQQWHSLQVQEGNYGEGYEALRLCVKATQVANCVICVPLEKVFLTQVNQLRGYYSKACFSCKLGSQNPRNWALKPHFFSASLI